MDRWADCLLSIGVYLGGCDWLQDGIIVEDPVLDVDDVVFVLGAADDELGEAGVDDQAAALGTGNDMLKKLAGGDIAAAEVDGAADAFAAGGGDDGVGLGVDAAADLIALTGGDAHFFADAIAKINAIASSAGCTVVAGGDDFIVAHDNCAVLLAGTGGTL